MALPLSYNVRNVRVRWQVTLLAVFGVALVVAVFAVLMSMSEGFASALRSTGRTDNAMIVQRGSGSELTSGVPLADRNMIAVDERVARDASGQPLASWEWVVVLGLPRASDGQPANVTLRAVTPRAFEVRGGITVVEGRRFTPGLDEVIVGKKLTSRIRGLSIGAEVPYQQKRFKIVGLFESTGGAFESEIWGDFDTFGAIFQRGAGSNSLVVRMKDPAAIPELDRWIRAQPQMQLQALSERKYYEDQAGPLARTLRGLATFVAVVMGIGAVFGAINTMYAIVSARTREIGTLRALGFSRRSILASFLIESVILAVIGGAIGCLLAFPMNGFSTGTGQTQSFSEIAFAFRITPGIVATGMTFAVLMGVLGGLLPALRAARMPITSALREA
jgi:putative ABC transport system permease protein